MTDKEKEVIRKEAKTISNKYKKIIELYDKIDSAEFVIQASEKYGAPHPTPDIVNYIQGLYAKLERLLKEVSEVK